MNRARLFFRFSDIANKYRRNYRRYPNVEVVRNVPYSDIDEKYNKADLLFPKNIDKNKKLPVLLNVHGGGFVAGDKGLRIGICRMFADNGWFVYNINYRLCHKFPAPNCSIDVINAINFLPSLGKQYNLDLDKIVLTGDSAGGYLVAHAMSSIADSHVREALNMPQCKLKIRALMLFCGIYNFEETLSKKAPFGLIRSLGSSIMGFDIEDKEKYSSFPYIKELSPINYVNDSWPETFVSMAKKDMFCGGQGEEMAKALIKNGVKTTIYQAYTMGETHCSHLLPYKNSSKEWLKAAIIFLDTIK